MGPWRGDFAGERSGTGEFSPRPSKKEELSASPGGSGGVSPPVVRMSISLSLCPAFSLFLFLCSSLSPCLDNNIYACVCVCVYVCVCVCMYACVHACMHVCIHVST